MKRLLRLLSFTTVLVLFTTTFTACTSGEMALFNAMLKSQSITSMESKTDFSVKIEATGLTEQQQQSFQKTAGILNNSKLTFNQKLNQNTDKTIIKSQIDTSVEFGGMAMNLGVWVDCDFTSKQPKFKEIIKLPLMLTMSMPDKMRGKEYMVLDFDEMTETDPYSMAGLKQMVDVSRNFEKKLTDFFKKYALQYKPGIEVVKLKENKYISGESMPVYQLKLSDETFKALLKYTTNDLLKNKDAINLIKEYMVMMAEMPQLSENQHAVDKAEIERMLKEFDEGLPQFTEDANKFFDALKNVKILGEKGITIDFAINRNGYIVNETGTVDLIIDEGALEQAFTPYGPNELDEFSVKEKESKGVYKFTFNFSTSIENINKNVEIKFPELNETNSFDVFKEIQSSSKGKTF